MKKIFKQLTNINRRRKLWVSVILLGILIVFTTLFYSQRMCINQTEEELLKTADYIKIQYAAYDCYISNSEKPEYTLMLQNILEGYQVPAVGTIIVADEDKIIASNNTDFTGQKTADNDIIQILKENTDSGSITHIPINHSYGIMVEWKDYYIYVYMPEGQIYPPMHRNTQIALLLYSAIAGTCMLQSKNAEKKRKKLELKKEIEYNRREYKNKKEQFDRVVELLSKMKCVVCEYDLASGKVSVNELFQSILGYEIKDDFFVRINEHKRTHPEFDFDGLLREVHYAVDKKATTSFESIFQKDRYEYKMLSVTLMPVLGKNEEVVKILGNIRENSIEHQELKKKVDMFDQIPGGTRRYYLGNPVCLEYVGENLARMLGYDAADMKNISADQYINIVIEEDRDRFHEFIKNAALSPGVSTCQYGVYSSGQEIITVLDTMESIRNDSGNMYGYSVVVDISEYARRQNIIRQEVEQLEHNLEAVRIRNSVSQMQPHFLYNALSSIREVMLQNQKYASDLLYDFTVYLRACIRTMQSGDPITIQQEMENIRSYVNIEKMRMGSRLNIVYELQSEEFKVPPLSIQPIVENAIRHGIYRKGKKGGTVTVKTYTLDKYNKIVIKDDGVGFDYEKIRNEVAEGKRESIGLDNIMFRLKKHHNAKVVIKSKVGVGTQISIWIPREKED